MWIMREISIVYHRMTQGLFVALTMTTIFLAGCAPQANTATTAPVRQSTLTPTPSLTWRDVTSSAWYQLPKEAISVAVSPVDGHNAWACAPTSTGAGSFTIWATKDAGASWQQVSTLTPVTSEPPRNCNLVADQSDPVSVMAMASWGAGADGTLRTVSNLSSDGGAHWHQLQGKVQTMALETIGGNIYASLLDTSNVAESAQLATITAGSDPLRWQVMSPTGLAANEGIFKFWMHAPNGGLFAATTRGAFWYSVDAGASWKRMTSPGGQVIFGMWLPQQGHWLFCGLTGAGTPSLACSTDNGASWHPQPALDASPDCIVTALVPDGSMLATCPVRARDGGVTSYTLYRLALGATEWRAVGSAPTDEITVTATGQMWAINAQMGTISVAAMPL